MFRELENLHIWHGLLALVNTPGLDRGDFGRSQLFWQIRYHTFATTRYVTPLGCNEERSCAINIDSWNWLADNYLGAINWY